MGQFSWIYSDTEEQLLDDVVADTYLLVPPAFQEKYGESIHERCYDGYGHFGGHDVYDLIALWNKEMIPEILRRKANGNWQARILDEDIEHLQNFYHDKKIECELRHIGIMMACHDEDNAALEYPVKITRSPRDYNTTSPSLRDPKQGWSSDDYDEWY